jgi:osmotically-inducible protein OsmY
MRTDAELKSDVMDELEWDPSINATAIGVMVKEGVVTLTGHLDTFAEKYAVERAVRRVYGVKAIAMELDVKLSSEHKRGDSDIAAAVIHALAWNSMVPRDRITVEVEHGWVTLSGQVDWRFQRDHAERAVRPLVGVKGLSNNIRVKPQVISLDIVSRIEGALARQAAREARRIQVSVDKGIVTLRGKVHSWAEREAAAGAAMAAQGVAEVDNQLTVGA